jgi:UDP-N-acetylmuramoyl-tripeptide--D-alanyl-D-alanine ligase
VGTEHVTAFGSLERIQIEKQRLVERLPPGGLAVLHGDDPRVRAMATATRARAVTFGLGANNDYSAARVRLDWPHGTRFEAVTPDNRFEISIRLLGRPAVIAALAALAVARELDQPLATTLAHLADVPPAPARLEPVALADGIWVLRDDYKAELETIDTALEVFAEIPARRKLVVLGPISEPQHPVRAAYRGLGERLAGMADLVLACGPYRTGFEALVSGACAAGLAREALVYCGSVADTAARLGAELRPGDVVLLKGQGNLRLERILLAISGVHVGCTVRRCYVPGLDCARCPMLERGWTGLREVT